VESDHALSQEDIDALFQLQSSKTPSGAARAAHAQRYDFRRSDRIPKEQIRALRVVHDTFARSLASSLSAYLRTYVTVNLISVEQLSFREFTSTLPSPTCIATMGVSPFDGVAILEINPSLAFPLIELMLGGGKIKPVVVERELTDIEQQILDTLLGLILQNLSFAWQSVSRVNFTVESHEAEPALLHVLPPNEAIVTIATEIQLAETSGMMNIGIPASIVKLLRQRFDQQWSARKAASSDDEGGRMMSRIAASSIRLDARLEGSTVSLDDLLRLSEGDVLMLDNAVGNLIRLHVNGVAKFHAEVRARGHRKAASIVEGD
jgi:flagellar motor switch protein FliM